MKPTPKSSIRDIVSTREAIALATLLSVAHSAAAEPAKKEEPKNQKKKGQDGEVLDEVSVTAARENTYKTETLTSPKYTVPLRDVPQTVTVIPKELIQEQNATTLTEVLRNIPGITMTGGENGNAGAVGGDAVMMRGFDASGSIFLDGVRDSNLAFRDTFNTETAEVFLGPTGSDVGRGNAAGYINQVTKIPHLKNEYLLSGQYGSADHQRYTADVNQEIPGLNGTAVRLNGVFQDGGIAGRDFVDRQIWGLAPSIAFGLGTDFRAIFSYQHVEQHNTPDYGLPANRNHLAPGVDTEWFYGTLDDYEDIIQDTFTARLEYDVNDNLSIRNQTRYNETTRETLGVRPSYNKTTDLMNRTFAQGDRENSVFSNQTTATYKLETGNIKQTFVGALEFTNEKQFSYTLAGGGSFVGTAPGIEPSHHVPANFTNWGRNPFAVSHGETDTIGLSIFDTVEIGDKWIVSGGLRMDSYDSEFHSVTTAGVPTPATGGKFKTSDEVYSGKLGVTYKPVETASIYAAYSRTVTPPGTSNFTLNETATSTANINADPQESENFEIGTKWDLFDSKLALTGAVFYTQNTNFIYLEDAATNTYSADGGQEIFGVTVGAMGQITENWAILSSITYLDGSIDQKGNAIDGNRLSRTPDWSASLWTTYKLPKGFTVGLGMRCQDSVNTSTVDAPPTMPGYVVFDGFVRYDVNENLNVKLNLYNLLDTEYISSTSGGGGGDGGGTGGTTGGGVDASGNRIFYGAPLSFALSMNYKF